MPSYVKLIYPSETSQISFESPFVDFGNKFIYRHYYKENGLVNIALSPEVVSDEEFPPTISSIQISNDSNFNNYKEIDLLLFDLTKNNWFEVSIAGTVVTPAAHNGIVGTNQPTNQYLQFTTSEITEITAQTSGVICLRGWPVSSSEGTKTVYIRFKLSDDSLYPPTDSLYSKGFYDSIIWQKSLPTTPGKPLSINSTSDGYVSDSIFWTFDKSQDLISGLDHYSLNLKKEGNEKFNHFFESKDHIIEPGTNNLSYLEEDIIEQDGNMVFIARKHTTGNSHLSEMYHACNVS